MNPDEFLVFKPTLTAGFRPILQIAEFQPGEVLVTNKTDPDWEPIMKKAGAIVTNQGGRTCHAAIIAREMGIPAIVGCSDATSAIATGQPVTVSCAEGDIGRVYDGLLPFEVIETELSQIPATHTQILMNVGTPDEGRQVLAEMAENGLKQGNGLESLYDVRSAQQRHPSCRILPNL